MTLAFDFDETITDFPEFFTTLGRLFRENGHKVYILTGREKRQLYNEPLPTQVNTMYPLEATYGRDWYDDILTWDLRNAQDDANGAFMTNEVKVATFKKRICEEYGIDIYFDDRGDLIKALGGVNIFTVTKGN